MVTTRRQAAAANTPIKGQAGEAITEMNGVNGHANGHAGLASPTPRRSARKSNTGSKTWAETDGTGDRNAVWGLSGTAGKIASLLGAVTLMVGCPLFAIITWYTLAENNGSILATLTQAWTGGIPSLRAMWPTPSATAWKVVAGFGALEAALQLLVPGKEFRGPVSPKGNTPLYKANGVQRYVATLFILGVGWYSGYLRPALAYDLFGEILSALNLFSLLFCLFLYIKGWAAPSSSDSGTTGSLVYDYYWGMELYPRIGPFDLKTWTNCSMGMMSWAVLPLCYMAKQYELYGYVSNSMMVSVALQQIYVFKFFLWESGYWCTMDIAHDRAGYYICWGCLVWVPSIYTSPALYLVKAPNNLHPLVATFFLVAGIAMIYINYDADKQRQVFRETNGKSPVWGKHPKIIHAEYVTKDGATKSSILLASGWWGLSRHFHYVPEILGAFFWSVPALFVAFMPYFYVVFLTLLLADRAYRDDERCAAKYGKYWTQYRKLVPYKIVPYVF